MHTLLTVLPALSTNSIFTAHLLMGKTVLDTDRNTWWVNLVMMEALNECTE